MKHKFLYKYVQIIIVEDMFGAPMVYAKAKRQCFGDHYTLVNETLNVYGKSERGTLFVILRALGVEHFERILIDHVPPAIEHCEDWCPGAEEMSSTALS